MSVIRRRVNAFSTSLGVSTSEKKILANHYATGRKINCLIINPDILTQKLTEKKFFKEKCVYNEWYGEIDPQLISHINENTYDFIIVDKWINSSYSNLRINFLPLGKKNANKVISVASFYEKFTHCSPILFMDSYLHNADRPLIKNTGWFFRVTKRLMDIGISVTLAPFAVIFFLIGAIATKLTSRGPIIFKQNRVGLNGKVFSIYKIRTMVHSPKGFNLHTTQNDRRITQIGKILRKTKIDELPQLYNVLIGDMSLIGPRPEKKDIVDRFAKENRFYNFRHTVKPGITGWAQVNNPTATPEENLEKLEYDLYYINNASLKLELLILFKTVGVVSTMDSL